MMGVRARSFFSGYVFSACPIVVLTLHTQMRYTLSVSFLWKEVTFMAQTQTRDEIINLRASKRQKTLIDQAAELLDMSRSEFMLDVARREAEALLLDQHHFTLPEEKFKRFLAALDEPPKGNAKLRKLLQSKAPWER